MSSVSSPAVFSSISDVERDVGVAKETLRVWERRYAFPQPLRNANGERIYPADQVHRLGLVKRLIDQGYRPGKIMHLDIDALARLGPRATPTVAPAELDRPDIDDCIELIKTAQMPLLRQRLVEQLRARGLRRFVTESIAPLTAAVGLAWVSGRLAVFEEHLYAELVNTVLRGAIQDASAHAAHATATPRIVLTTLAQERHGLGLLMAEALFTLEGAHCISLGVQTPLAEIVEAARAQRADIVALSFAGATSPRGVVNNVNDLRERLRGLAELWVGGSAAELARRHLAPGTVLDLGEIAGALAHWRARAPRQPI
jgi:DNA-binding transcriptional MerR regulator/methylmalonyl-CoA mutase cobalamin-binding subunit